MAPFLTEAVEATWSQKKFQMVDQAQTSTTQETTEHQFLVDLSKHLVKPGLYFISIPNGWPCMYTDGIISLHFADFST